jgi:hypothetical protein
MNWPAADPSRLFGQPLQRSELFSHHDQVAPREQLETYPVPPAGRLVHEKPDDETGGRRRLGRHAVGDGDYPVEPLRRGNRAPGDVFVRGEIGDLCDEESLARGQRIHAGRQGPRAPAAKVVDPVVAVRRHPQLTEPAEHHRSRSVDVDAAGQPSDRGLYEPITGIVGRNLGSGHVPGIGQPLDHITSLVHEASLLETAGRRIGEIAGSTAGPGEDGCRPHGMDVSG